MLCQECAIAIQALFYEIIKMATSQRNLATALKYRSADVNT